MLATTTVGHVGVGNYLGTHHCLTCALPPTSTPTPTPTQILSSIILCGEATEVVSLAVTAAECMREVAVGKETAMFRPPAKDSGSKTETVSQ